MKVFFYIPTLASGGAEKQCAIIAAGLRREHGVDTSIILDYGDKIKETNRVIIERSNVPIIALPKNKLKAIFALWRLFSANKDAVLFTYLARPNFVGALIGRLTGIKRIYSGIRCGWLPKHKLMAEISVNRILSTKTIFNSYRGLTHFVQQGFRQNKAMVISNAIELWDDCPVREYDSSRLIKVVTVGRFMPEKDYYTWLSSIRAAIDKGADIEAYIVGWGRLESEVKGWIAELKLSDRVTLYPGDYDVKKLLYECDIYLSTSTSEGVSNSILEAMNASLPVVATDVGDNDRMIENGKSGYLTAIKDVSALADGIVALTVNGKLRCDFGARACEILSERYSVENVLSQYLDLI